MITLNKKILKSVSLLICYSLAEEKRHWEECNKPKNHIYNDIRKIKQWLKNNNKNNYEQ